MGNIGTREEQSQNRGLRICPSSSQRRDERSKRIACRRAGRGYEDDEAEMTMDQNRVARRGRSGK